MEGTLRFKVGDYVQFIESQRYVLWVYFGIPEDQITVLKVAKINYVKDKTNFMYLHGLENTKDTYSLEFTLKGQQYITAEDEHLEYHLPSMRAERIGNLEY